MKTQSHIKNIIAVASGKGGVGKSTTAVNLALALHQQGHQVGLLDADIYGPNQPKMVGTEGAQPEILGEKAIKPVEAFGIKTMSIAYLVEQDTPMIWRGPMVGNALLQLFNDTAWGELDYLIIDLPPGTGDVQLSLSQKIPVTGVVIVTTPQDVALLDVKKAIAMFEKVNVPLWGVIENMSTHICSECGHEEAIFGQGGGEAIKDQYDLEFLGSLPLDISIRMQADIGEPIVVADPTSKIAQTYFEIAKKVSEKAKSKSTKIQMPKIVVENA